MLVNLNKLKRWPAPYLPVRTGIARCREPVEKEKLVKDRVGLIDGEEGEAEPKALTREEAQALRRRQPSLVVSPWRVVAVQSVAGLVVAAIWWLVDSRSGLRNEAALSALYGAAAVVMPHAVMALGLGRLKGAGPGAMVMGFMFWEFMKIGLTVAMLLVAGVTLHWLNWPAVLVAMVVCTKMNWLVLLLRSRVANKTLGTRH